MTDIQLVHCNECGRRSRHSVKAEYHTDSAENIVDAEDIVHWTERHAVMECGGCGTIVFRTRLWFSELQDYGSDPVYQDTYFPPRLDRPLPAWFADLPEDLEEVLAETYNAYYNDQRYLAAVGIRTSLDMGIVNKIGDAGTFQDKVELLHMSGLVTEADTALLIAALEAGNAAAHRGFRPSKDDLEVMLDILESVLDALFVKAERLELLRRAAEEVRQRIPPRPQREKRRRGE